MRNGKREASSQPLTPGNSENKFLSHLCLLQSLPRHVLFSLPVIDTEPGCSRAALSLPHCRHISWVPIVWHQLGRWEGCRLPPLGAVSWAASLLGWGNRGAWTHVLALGIFCSASCCPACLSGRYFLMLTTWLQQHQPSLVLTYCPKAEGSCVCVF